MAAAAREIGGQAGEQLRAEAHGRTLAITAALITLVRGPERVRAVTLDRGSERRYRGVPPRLLDPPG
jgi:hypothetical protein